VGGGGGTRDQLVFTILAIKECKWRMWELGFIYYKAFFIGGESSPAIYSTINVTHNLVLAIRNYRCLREGCGLHLLGVSIMHAGI
jgi:hypothetical protein